MKTYLPPNKFYSAVDIPSSADEAGASALAPTPDAPADLSQSDGVRSSSLPLGESDPLVTLDCTPSEAAIDSCQEPVTADIIPCAGAEPATSQADHDGEALGRTGCSIQPTGATDLLQALGALSGTDLIHEIFAVKPKHFKLKHKRRIALPRFAPDYEAMESAMHNPNAPRTLETDPVWADPAPVFLRDA